MTIKKLIKEYQKAWNEHNLEKLAKLFDSKIRLKDWDINIKGKKKVLRANKKIFESVKNIRCVAKQTIISKNKAACEVDVIVNKKKINVIDIIKFNSKKKIVDIKAFKI